MTKKEILIEKEIISRLEKKCGVRKGCKGCPHFKRNTDFHSGCYSKIAVKLILEDRAKIKDLEEKIKQKEEL